MEDYKQKKDERIREDIVTYLMQLANSATLKVNAQKFNKWITWLEKQCEQKPTWSEEDEQMIDDIIEAIDKQYAVSDYQEMVNWLKSLKERVQPKQKCDWGDEDEARYYGVLETEQYMLDVVNGIKKFDVGNEQIKEECTKELAWLKSLKERMKGE